MAVDLVFGSFIGLIYGASLAHGAALIFEIETGQAPSLQLVMVRGRLGPFAYNYALAALPLRALCGGGALPRRDGAEPRHHTNCHHTNWGLGGTRFRDGRMRRLLVRLSLPSGLLRVLVGRARCLFPHCSPVLTLKL